MWPALCSISGILHNLPSTFKSIEYLTTNKQLVTLKKKPIFFTHALQLTWKNIMWWFSFLLLWILSFHKLETQSTR